ncbi:MAG TPA: DUF948 domain-containing protein [Mycobacteriales bacterium]|nr:DUF948 domain-containing protein [Mycobacteriales bacterium]
MLSGGQVAALIVAVAWAVLVCFLSYVLVKLGKVIGAAGGLVRGVTDETVPLIAEMKLTVGQVNTELGRVDSITEHVQEISGNVSAMTSLVSATVGSPIIKVAAFSYGVRRAIGDRNRADVEKRVKDELKAQRAARRRAKRDG